MSGTATFRWDFRTRDRQNTSYAEVILEEGGRVADRRFMAAVYLVHDEMKKPRTVKGVLQIDPDLRTGKRTYVGYIDPKVAHTLAYIAPVEAPRFVYPHIFDALVENFDAVERFGDAWLTETITEAIKHREAIDAIA